MLRRILIAAMAIGLVGSIVALPADSAPALLAQDETEAQDAESESVQQANVDVAELELGQRFGMEAWEIEVLDVFLDASLFRFGYDEVRVSVAFVTAGDPLPYAFDAFTGVQGFPMLQLRDAAGEVWESPVTRPGSNMFPGSTLHTIESNIPANWTVGFDVPQSASDEMSVEAVWNGNVVASWDLNSSPSEPAGWDTPPGASEALPGDTIEWSDDIDITIVGHLLQVCGIPEIERVTSFYVLNLEVENLSDRDALFPDVRFPESLGTAVWADGSSARYSVPITYSDPLIDSGILPNLRNVEQLIIPPRTTVTIGLAFPVPRDGRLVDPEQTPNAVLLNATAGGRWWFDMSNQSIDSTFTVTCDAFFGSGSFGFQIGLPEGVEIAQEITGDV